MDYYKTVQWAERRHKEWMSSFADEDEFLAEDEIRGDDDDTPDFDNQE